MIAQSTGAAGESLARLGSASLGRLFGVVYFVDRGPLVQSPFLLGNPLPSQASPSLALGMRFARAAARRGLFLPGALKPQFRSEVGIEALVGPEGEEIEPDEPDDEG
jgi:hypothetical protein